MDLLFFIGVLLMMGLTNYDVVLVLVLVALYPYLRLTGRLRLFGAFGIAVLMSVAWGYFAVDFYQYALTGLKIGVFNLYPVFFWTYGLFIVKLVYSDLKPLFRARGKATKLLIFSSLFWVGLITAEYVAFHLFGIRNLATAGNPGLPLIDAIHAPLWMQVSYFLMGPLYFLLLETAEARISFFRGRNRR